MLGPVQDDDEYEEDDDNSNNNNNNITDNTETHKLYLTQKRHHTYSYPYHNNNINNDFIALGYFIA